MLTGLLTPAVTHFASGRRRRQELAEKDRDKLGQVFDEVLVAMNQVWSDYIERLRALIHHRTGADDGHLPDLRSGMERDLDRLDLLIQRAEILGASSSLAEASDKLARFCYDFLALPVGAHFSIEEERSVKGQQSDAVAAMARMKNAMAADLVRLRLAG